MKKIKLISLTMLLFGILMTSCTDDKTDDPQTNNYKKISQINKGTTTDSLQIYEKFTWTGDNLNKLEDYEDGSVTNSTVVLYSGSNITEIQNYEDTTISTLKSMIKRINNYYASIGKKELTQTQRMVIHRTDDGTVDYIDIYAEMNKKDLPLLGYFQIEYDGSKPIKNDLYIGSHSQSIIFMSTIATYQNETITTLVNKTNIKIMSMGVQMMTMDSTVYTYDDKISIFSSMKDRFPMIDAQILSQNNIVTEMEYGIGTDGSLILNTETFTTFQYDSDNYPISATRTVNQQQEVITYTYL